MSKEDISGQYIPLFEGYVSRLINEMAEKGMFVKDGNVYRPQAQAFPVKAEEPAQKSFFSLLMELRNIAAGVCTNLYPEYSSAANRSFSRSLRKLEEEQAITLDWQRKKDILETLDNIDAIAADAEVQAEVETMAKENNININQLISDILVFYGEKKAVSFFTAFGYKFRKTKQKGPDVVLEDDMHFFTPLVFEFKLRKTNPVPDRKMLLQSLDLLKQAGMNKEHRPFIMLLVFTYEASPSFPKLNFRFREIINSMVEFERYRDQLLFLPVSLVELHLVDLGFQEFVRKNLRDHFKRQFNAQPPPRAFPGRNDHFIDDDIDLRHCELKVIITPVNSPYWRFGLRFIRNVGGRFPTRDQVRHRSKLVGDIYLSVGDILKSGEKQWSNPAHLSMQSYHADMIEDNFKELDDYNGVPVTLTVIADTDCSRVVFSVEVGGRSCGERVYNLREFGACRLFAFADHTAFNLEAEIDMQFKYP